MANKQPNTPEKPDRLPLVDGEGLEDDDLPYAAGDSGDDLLTDDDFEKTADDDAYAGAGKRKH